MRKKDLENDEFWRPIKFKTVIAVKKNLHLNYI